MIRTTCKTELKTSCGEMFYRTTRYKSEIKMILYKTDNIHIIYKNNVSIAVQVSMVYSSNNVCQPSVVCLRVRKHLYTCGGNGTTIIEPL